MNEPIPAPDRKAAPLDPAPAWMQVAGVVVGLLLGFVTAVWAVFTSPLYAGTIPLPVSPIIAVVSNVALIWFTRQVTGRTGLALLPGVVWFATMIVSASPTKAGDLLIPSNDYMGLAAILLGCASWGIAGYWAMLRQRPSANSKPISVQSTTAKTAPTAKPGPGAKPAPGAKPGPKRQSGTQPQSGGGGKAVPSGGGRRPTKPSGQ